MNVAAATVVRGPGVHRVHVDPPRPREIRFTNEDPHHSVFVDLFRVETGREGRIVLEPLESSTATLAPGDVEITLGRGARLEIA